MPSSSCSNSPFRSRNAASCGADASFSSVAYIRRLSETETVRSTQNSVASSFVTVFLLVACVYGA